MHTDFYAEKSYCRIFPRIPVCHNTLPKHTNCVAYTNFP